ncbi:HGL120Cp [Eremothecium sinecaudum]|uniref:HGL120Cp n=1 Tax=Eremothecium sinecaudum TaxID=45286 RepID=A0A0X8HVL6_9SACH|nr:HGL120Cp [Eremothecium sinecaudum]AMD22220.1 HGL120Cp [Eremothecium sinecaudum]
MTHDTIIMSTLINEYGSIFSSERIDHYPLEYEDLKKYLTENAIEDENMRLIVDVDDSYLSGEGAGDGEEFDIQNKLYLEYANYRSGPAVQRQFLDVITERQEQELLVGMVDVLKEKVNIYSRHIQELKDTIAHQKHENPAEHDHRLDELLSYMLSAMIKGGVDFHSQVETRDTLELCRKGIDILLERCLAEKRKSNAQLRNSSWTDINGAPEAELKTALEDLQLAHRFLTERYRADRKQSMKQIEYLSKVNKDLQQELLSYHSRFCQARDQIQAFDVTPPSTISTHNTPPSEDLQKSPRSVQSNLSVQTSTSASFQVMKKEFKKMLNETQYRYEMELKQERELRRKLEEQISSGL